MDGKLCVIGSGTWGTAAASLLASAGRDVVIWARSAEVVESINREHRNCKHLPELVLPPTLCATSSFEEALKGAVACILATPSAYLRTTCAAMAECVPADMPVLILTKGIEPKTKLLMADVVAEEFGAPSRLAVLSGPNHAEEVARGLISAAVIASSNPETAAFFQNIFFSENFRAYVSTDLTGIEVCGATKNVVAIAAGIAHAMGAGDNTLAALMTRGLAEVGRLSAACGGDPLSCMGLAGMGDLIATCTSAHSRNRSFGEALVSGETLEEYQARTGMVVEGAAAANSAWELARAHGVDTPVIDVVHDILVKKLPVEKAVARLLERSPKSELYGLS